VFYQPKIYSVGTVSEFMNRDSLREIKKSIKRFNKKAVAHGIKASLTTLAGATAIGITNSSFATQAYAQGPAEYVKGAAKEKIVEAFMPLVDMIQALSYPIALVMLTGGSLLFMINQKDKGISLIQNASIGYILVQLMPLMMQLLVGIGNTVT
jgi:hypothetical protein